MNYFGCGKVRAHCQPPCRDSSVGACMFELRGVRTGEKCGRQVCPVHSRVVGGKRLCLPHARFTAAQIGSWLPIVDRDRDAVPGTTEVFVATSNNVRARVWRWSGYKKWSWSAVDANGDSHEDRPDARGAKLFDTVEQAKAHALAVAGIEVPL